MRKEEGEKWRERRRWKSTKSHRCVEEVVLFVAEVIIVIIAPIVIIAAGVVAVAAVAAVLL